MEASGQLHAPAALPPGKAPPIPTGYEAWWAPESVWMLWRRDKSCTARNRTQVVQLIVHRCTDWLFIKLLQQYMCVVQLTWVVHFSNSRYHIPELKIRLPAFQCGGLKILTFQRNMSPSSGFLWNISIHLQDYTVSQPRRPHLNKHCHGNPKTYVRTLLL
jgi:hypothetical protein